MGQAGVVEARAVSLLIGIGVLAAAWLGGWIGVVCVMAFRYGPATQAIHTFYFGLMAPVGLYMEDNYIYYCPLGLVAYSMEIAE
jgi:ABC-type amino acid transport system permease subunit